MPSEPERRGAGAAERENEALATLADLLYRYGRWCASETESFQRGDPAGVKLAGGKRAAIHTEFYALAAALTERLAKLSDERNKWRAFAEHQELCSTCGEDFVGKCDDGRTLRDAALGIVADDGDQPEANDGD